VTLAPDPFGSGLGGGQAQSADRATNLGRLKPLKKKLKNMTK